MSRTLARADTRACAEVANEEPCTWLCGATNYTTWVQCLNCVVANGEQDVTPADMSTVLQNTNSYCANVNGFAPTSAITATPTTTGPFESDFTVASTATGRHPDLTFPIWTGLATLADPNFYSDLNAEIDSRASATFSIDPSDTPVIVGHGSPTGSLAAGSVTQSTVSRSMVEGPTIGQGSAGASSAAATTSGAASRVMEGAKMGGVAGMILGVVLA